MPPWPSRAVATSWAGDVVAEAQGLARLSTGARARRLADAKIAATVRHGGAPFARWLGVGGARRTGLGARRCLTRMSPLVDWVTGPRSGKALCRIASLRWWSQVTLEQSWNSPTITCELSATRTPSRPAESIHVAGAACRCSREPSDARLNLADAQARRTSAPNVVTNHWANSRRALDSDFFGAPRSTCTCRAPGQPPEARAQSVPVKAGAT
jgi:hypothetical protein